MCMNITIREYESKDFSAILPLADRFEDYLIALDDLGRLKREEGFAEQYLNFTLKNNCDDNIIEVLTPNINA